uniref:EF-hand domain-containing protein n=2 Tax=Guillardia theta TaxID=55529 RepID=A0A7S4PDB7_GUITH|mmetsp:Transcript_48464/g.151984  ORF Transcript_48464/g.151984 Transcript_48464/m.151984 type:complete len:897 (+) Transcript_48464:394-3084(+)
MKSVQETPKRLGFLNQAQFILQQQERVLNNVVSSLGFNRASSSDSSVIPATPSSSKENDVEYLLDQYDAFASCGKDITTWFDNIDFDSSADLTREEFKKYLNQNAKILNDAEIGVLFDYFDSNKNNSIDFKEFIECLKRRRYLRRLAHFLDKLPLGQIIAEQVAGDFSVDDDPIESLRRRSKGDLAESMAGLGAVIAEKIQGRMTDYYEERRKGWQTGKLNTSKFLANDEQNAEGIFLESDTFLEGIDNMIGLPNKDVFEAMKAEHNVHDVFCAGHLKDTTTPLNEWKFVVDPDPTSTYSGEGEGADCRTRISLGELMERDEYKSSKLTKEELIGLRLYTGPMYMLYNESLRDYLSKHKSSSPSRRSVRKKMNYVTTIRMIASGILKLSKLSSLPPNRKVYRGLANVKLPVFMVSSDHLGFRGAVEPAFMSTTTRKEVAIQYLQLKHDVSPKILEMEVGQIDRGADVAWLSQYPAENEILYPPLSNLEIIGPLRTELIQTNEVIMISVRVNINLKSTAREYVEGKRKFLYLQSLDFVVQEIERDLHAQVEDLPSADRFFRDQENSKKVIDQILQECCDFRVAHEQKPVASFNMEIFFRQKVDELSHLHSAAMSKLHFWKHTKGVTPANISEMSLFDVRMLIAGNMWEDYYTKKASRADEDEVRRAALNVCRFLGYKVEDEISGEECSEVDRSSLLAAASSGDKRMVGVLLDSGCNVSIANDEHTAISLTAQNGHVACMQLLIDRQADIHFRSSKGETPLMLACKFGRLACAKLLIENLQKRGELNRLADKDEKGRTCLHLAADNDQVSVIEELCRHAAVPDFFAAVAFESQKTCLHYAAGRGHLRVVSLLLSSHPELATITDKKGRTAETFARELSHMEVAEFLRNAEVTGADAAG